VSAPQRSLRLRSVAVDRIDFELVANGFVERVVAVIRDAGGRIVFPEPMVSDVCRSLGSEAADAHVRERAREEFTRLDGYLAASRGRRR
jgi:hypothetical protein